MKNVQVIDDAINCTYDVFEATDDEFYAIFPDGRDIEFSDEFFERVGTRAANKICKALWCRKKDKKEIQGLHGTLFYGHDSKKPYYPTKKESEMITKFIPF